VGFSLLPGASCRMHPSNGVKGFQKDGQGTVYCGVAHTPHGDICGKAKDGQCWYPYGGVETSTTNFSWLCVPRVHLVRSNTQPMNAIQVGFQNDGSGPHCAAVAHTPSLGDIPGKAKDGTCWYSIGGKEHVATNWSWVCRK